MILCNFYQNVRIGEHINQILTTLHCSCDVLPRGRGVVAAGAQVRGQPGGGAHAADLPPPRQRQAQRTLPAGGFSVDYGRGTNSNDLLSNL